MLKLQCRRLSWDGLGITTAAIAPLTLGIALMAATTVPASAQSVLERGMTSAPTIYPNQSGVVVEPGYGYSVNQSPAAPYIYGSPISTPMLVNPSTGQRPSNTSNNYYSYPATSYPVRGRVDDSTLVNPVLINPKIKDSTLINPVIVNDPVYRVPVRYPRSHNIRIYGY